MRIYNYIFFKISQILSGFIESPSFAAIIIMCWLFMFNSFSLIYFLWDIVDLSVLLNSYASIPGGILVVGGHFYYYYRRGKHVRIYERFKDEEKLSSVFGIIGTLSYFFLSIWIFFHYAAPNMGGILK